MKLVYTDDRFPGLEVINHGVGLFEVAHDGKVVTTFESWENPDGTLTEAFATRRARDYFERLDQPEVLVEPISRPRGIASESTARQIDNLITESWLERDSRKKAALCERVRTLMQEEESVAAATVRHLVET